MLGPHLPLENSPTHCVSGRALAAPYPPHLSKIRFGMGCFWGAERLFWSLPGVYVTAVGYAGGWVPDPSYQQVCTGKTGHAEVVCVVYDPQQICLAELLKVFFESHDPTQGMRQGNDIGSQYRSVIYTDDETSFQQAKDAIDRYEKALLQVGFSSVTTEVKQLDEFYLAEGNHQQYLAKNPKGYCGLKGTNVSCVL